MPPTRVGRFSGRLVGVWAVIFVVATGRIKFSTRGADMNNIKQHKASLDSPTTTHTPTPPSQEEIAAVTIAGTGGRHDEHSHCG
jgi:hypothetical protein